MSYPLVDEHDSPRITPAVQWLIAINVAIYFLQLTLVKPTDMLHALAFELPDLGHAWWTIFTYMFVHAGFWHLALNMYTLWLFGRRLERAWNSWAFVRYYLWCGLGGWLFHLMFVREGFLLGASAAVFGVMLAYAMRWPDEEIWLFGAIPMKVKWLVLTLTLLNVVEGVAGAGVAGSTGVAYFAHLGGLAFGWLYLRTPTAASLDRLRHRMTQAPDYPPDETPRAIPRSLPRRPERRDETDEVIAQSNAMAAKRPPALAPTAPTRDAKAEELNRVLDKISASGIDSLTTEERRLLDEMSRRLRGR